MTTIWEKFEAALPETPHASSVESSRLRPYPLAIDGACVTLFAEPITREALRLVVPHVKSRRTIRDLLLANQVLPYVKFALSRQADLQVQAEIAVDGFQHVSRLLASVRDALDYANGAERPARALRDKDTMAEDERVRRWDVLLRVDWPGAARQPDGSYLIKMSHAGLKTGQPIVAGRFLDGLRFKGLAATTPVDSEEAEHYLLSMNRYLCFSRTALADDGLPLVLSFAPFSDVDDGGPMERAARAVLEGLFQIHHVRALNQAAVRRVYHAFYMEAERR